jgi:hypothetical protein
MIHNRLRPLAWIATLGSIGASTALIAACSGGLVHNGTVSSTSQPVSVGEVSGAQPGRVVRRLPGRALHTVRDRGDRVSRPAHVLPARRQRPVRPAASPAYD